MRRYRKSAGRKPRYRYWTIQSAPGLKSAWLPKIGWMYQDTAGATPVTTGGEDVQRVSDYGPNGQHLLTEHTNHPVYDDGDVSVRFAAASANRMATASRVMNIGSETYFTIYWRGYTSGTGSQSVFGQYPPSASEGALDVNFGTAPFKWDFLLRAVNSASTARRQYTDAVTTKATWIFQRTAAEPRRVWIAKNAESNTGSEITQAAAGATFGNLSKFFVGNRDDGISSHFDGRCLPMAIYECEHDPWMRQMIRDEMALISP